MNQKKLQRLQLKKARNIVKYAYSNAQFFRNHFEGYDLNEVWNLPVSNKKLMMEYLSDYNTLNFKKQDLLDFCLEVEKTRDFNRRFRGFNVAMSSGTSGNKGIVITSPQEEKYLQAALFARFPFPRAFPIKWAFILRITTPAFNVSMFGQKMTYISQLNTLENIKMQLEQLKPNILSAPPSMLRILAKEVNKGKLEIKPKRIISYAEVLSPDIEKEIEEIFNLRIHQIYQASEGPIAMSCKYGTLHINEDLIYVQNVDINGDPTIPGEPCYKMILTDLNKKSQPVIRYELNDNIIIDDRKCGCGSSFRIIKRILGRTDDLFWSYQSDSEELQCIFPDYIRRAIITSSDEIEDYQAIQKDYSKLLIRIALKVGTIHQANIKKKIKDNIRQLFLRLKCVEPEIDINLEKPKVNPNSQKLIRIIREFEVDP